MWYPNPAAAAAYRDRQTRTLYVCIGVSMALHALAMISLPASQPASRSHEARVLTALFESLSEPAPAPRKPREHRQAQVPAPVQKSPEPAPAAAPEAPPASAPAEAPAESKAVASAPAQVPAAASTKTDATEILDPSLFDAYRLALINAAKRYKLYPVVARDRGWEGRVEIRLVVDANGTIKSALVKTSSRYQVLDEQALTMVKKAFNDPALQAAPRGREFTVDVPVIFELQTG